jgi:RNA polymerase sigma-70 factor (ECF subfamily)
VADGGAADGLGPFPATQWSLVDAMRGGGDEGARRAALAALLERYMPALRAYLVIERRLPRERADDLLQGFVADKVLERDLVAKADRARGKFRSFLLTALHRYAIDRARAEQARPGVTGAAAFEDVEPPAAPAARDAFDVAWAREVLREAVGRTRAHCERFGRADLWAVFDGRVLRPAFRDEPAVAYDALMPRFGWATAAQGANALVTAKRLFERELRAVVGEYAGDAEAVEEELRDLRGAWAGSGRGGAEVIG